MVDEVQHVLVPVVRQVALDNMPAPIVLNLNFGEETICSYLFTVKK